MTWAQRCVSRSASSLLSARDSTKSASSPFGLLGPPADGSAAPGPHPRHPVDGLLRILRGIVSTLEQDQIARPSGEVEPSSQKIRHPPCSASPRRAPRALRPDGRDTHASGRDRGSRADRSCPRKGSTFGVSNLQLEAWQRASEGHQLTPDSRASPALREGVSIKGAGLEGLGEAREGHGERGL